MKIKEDFSYLSNNDIFLIEKGFAKMGVYQFRLYRAENEIDKMNVANANRTTMKELEKHFIIGQWKENKDNYELWFWCNCKYNSTGKDSDRCLDYITLALKNKDDMKFVEKVKSILENINTTSNVAIVQYTAIYDYKKIKNTLSNVYENIKNKFVKMVDYFGITSKEIMIYKINNRYVYRFKKCRTMYELDNNDFLKIALANNLL